MWEEDAEEMPFVVPDHMLDVSYRIRCESLPLDHAYALGHAIQQALPWLLDEPDAGMHLIHGAESGNGWQRPEAADALLYLSRRTRFVLRLPHQYLTAAETLCGQTLSVAGHELQILSAETKRLQPAPVLFSRYVLTNPQYSEEQFTQHAVQALRALGIQCRKVLPGRTHEFKHPHGVWFCRSLMVADLSPEDAVRLLQYGIGSGRQQGFGLFIAHKDIKAVNPDAQKNPSDA